MTIGMMQKGMNTNKSMEQEIKTQLETLVDEALDYIFVQAHSIANTTSGDITPRQQQMYDEIAKDLKHLLISQVEQNMPGFVRLNGYGYEAGFHTPERTLESLNALNAAGIESVDISFHNDLSDCLDIVGRDYCLYIPNSENNDPDNEEFNTFSLYEVNEYGPSAGGGNEFSTIEEVIEFLKPTMRVVHFNGEEHTVRSEAEYDELLKTSPLVGKKCRLVHNLECFYEYKGQELEFIKELPDNYCILSDGVKTWHAGIEETDLFN